MDDIAALTHHIEYLFLKKIIAGLRNNSISIARAKESANAFLAIEPFTTAEDANAKIIDFVTKNAEFVELKNYMDSYEKEKNDLEKIKKMRQFIKQSDIDSALKVAKE